MSTYSEEVVRVPRAGTLYDVLELILDRGMVIDIFVRVSLVGIEILKIDARIVVASVDTYLRFAEACNRLDLENDSASRTVPELFGGSMTKSVGKSGAKKAARSVGDKVKKAVGAGDEDEDDEQDERHHRSKTSRSRSNGSERTRRRKQES
ncbi:gas vesicle structural protein GvpA [Streptomyces sp. NPDC050428]|uniref:gas vesicle structural protein GvpA n=1 Tax=Streptomyces sp. NPDC050428 TaxID=3155757 RepID=UPI003419DA0F